MEPSDTLYCFYCRRLWVADRDRHRVVVLDLVTEKPIAVFGTTDKPGTDLTSLTRVCGRGQGGCSLPPAERALPPGQLIR